MRAFILLAYFLISCGPIDVDTTVEKVVVENQVDPGAKPANEPEEHEQASKVSNLEDHEPSEAADFIQGEQISFDMVWKLRDDFGFEKHNYYIVDFLDYPEDVKFFRVQTSRDNMPFKWHDFRLQISVFTSTKCNAQNEPEVSWIDVWIMDQDGNISDPFRYEIPYNEIICRA